jgi:hypothetical protein
MDAGANPYERDLAASHFFRQLREQFSDGGYELLAELEGSHDSESSRYGSVTWPIGKYKGRPLSQIPSDYLLWALANLSALSRYLRCAVERYLQDTQYTNQPTN